MFLDALFFHGIMFVEKTLAEVILSLIMNFDFERLIISKKW